MHIHVSSYSWNISETMEDTTNNHCFFMHPRQWTEPFTCLSFYFILTFYIHPYCTGRKNEARELTLLSVIQLELEQGRSQVYSESSAQYYLSEISLGNVAECPSKWPLVWGVFICFLLRELSFTVQNLAMLGTCWVTDPPASF